jgi:hypothetical protein
MLVTTGREGEDSRHAKLKRSQSVTVDEVHVRARLEKEEDQGLLTNRAERMVKHGSPLIVLVVHIRTANLNQDLGELQRAVVHRGVQSGSALLSVESTWAL